MSNTRLLAHDRAASVQSMSLQVPLLSCMLIILLLFALALTTVLVLRLFRKQRPASQPANSTLHPAPMPSVVYEPPVNVVMDFGETTPLITQDQFPITDSHAVKQPYDAFLVLDVEATCFQGTGFEWPNEIIEWPVCLLRWKDKSVRGKASQLEVVGEFRSFVKPTWRPQLSQFCTDLTGITQAQVDYAPTFPKVLKMFATFLAQHGLIDLKSGKPLQRFCWCSDGPFDVRDFVVKQCFISNITMPLWLRGDVLDARKVVSIWAATNGASGSRRTNFKRFPPNHHYRSLNIPQQLHALRLGAFQGRAHSGIDDTRNIARIIVELARRGIRLVPNTPINPNKRWEWMGRPGEVIEYRLTYTLTTS